MVTLRTSLAAFRLKLWDEENERLVPFAPLRRRSADGGRAGRAPLAAD